MLKFEANADEKVDVDAKCERPSLLQCVASQGDGHKYISGIICVELYRLVQASLILDYTYYYMFSTISHSKRTVILYSVIQYNSRTEESKLMCTKSSLTSLHLSCY